jgi:hypothetical protein
MLQRSLVQIQPPLLSLADIAVRIRDIALGDDRARLLDILPMTEARGFLNI